ncbi:protein-L-isoaspartate(D-aspartate) O-methyltransferase [Limnohabitans sp. G3-2]|uniref:protein-L-isoaspartate(D-aspartate) O-methyltransferase n=1 Tax=Limnohabitans sp. G3-2 TaxID=1100711 RepID=UPI000C1E62FE|nr:protein-L-isoaspartate(D-aspartate) O-methyltransferase [Limnohabitans sp. G3-2]PIT74987.1 protein-L-isoaspartate O-methyltransferase [Limnohabitans sp. G3-2]
MTQRPGFPVKLTPSGTPRPAGKTTVGISARQAPLLPPSLNATQAAAKAAGSAMSRPDPLVSGLGLDSVAVRARMVRKLAEQGVQDPRVLSAMGQVERHRFVESALVNQAYEDTSLPIGLGQTISKPNVVARMVELLCQNTQGPLGRILEIGTGCGYQAAVLSHVASEVYSIERLRGLHEKARTNLRPFRLHNVHLIFGDGMLGYPKGAPYAGIISAAGGDAVPEAWLAQLAVGGRLIAPTITPAGHQALVVVLKTAEGFERQVLEAVHFVPLKSGVA